ncbi:MAG: sulfate adenylyltransferase subunit CysN [Geoalkalibacter sp.]|uniref:sulfate adenylyltransferase subunit CysN n=1 Tax=Geoalkalibacter sp. TaxID=3041440 RepID=UPI003D139D35
MAHQSTMIAEDIHAYLKAQEEKDMLRFITCGSVDDGKSTLIGRLLWDSKLIFEDQLAALEADSKKVGTQGEDIDYALLLDGLQAEREQGITIDVAYRFFSTDKRKFIVADTPGHEQYTRNMVTGASTAGVAVILIDARKGVLTQTKRHSYLVSLVGIRNVAVAVNKMDLVDYSQKRFDEICQDYQELAKDLDFEEITYIPISALKGDNVISASKTASADQEPQDSNLEPAVSNMPWYSGPTLLEFLETVQVADNAAEKPFRMRVQWVNRPNLDFRGFCGTIASGQVRPGDDVVVPSSGQTSRISRIVTMDGDLEVAYAGQSVTLCLTDEIDISRGDMLTTPLERPSHADQFEAKVVWLHENPLLPGRSYLLKAGSATAPAQVSELKRKINVNTLHFEPGKTLEMNEVGICNISINRAISFDPYRFNRHTGNFILIDRFTNATVGAGMIDFPLRRASNIHWQSIDIDKHSRAELKGQKPRVLWFTGLSGAGKSTIANLVEKKLHSLGKHTYLLDGDNIRHGLNRDLGFTDADRVENIRRIAEVSKLFVDAGMIVLTAFISPFRSERRLARELMEEGEFIEIFIDTPLDVCEQRDPKGLYKKARKGELKNFTGVDSAYEPPENPEIVVNGASASAEDLAERIVRELFG